MMLDLPNSHTTTRRKPPSFRQATDLNDGLGSLTALAASDPPPLPVPAAALGSSVAFSASSCSGRPAGVIGTSLDGPLLPPPASSSQPHAAGTGQASSAASGMAAEGALAAHPPPWSRGTREGKKIRAARNPEGQGRNDSSGGGDGNGGGGSGSSSSSSSISSIISSSSASTGTGKGGGRKRPRHPLRGAAGGRAELGGAPEAVVLDKSPGPGGEGGGLLCGFGGLSGSSGGAEAAGLSRAETVARSPRKASAPLQQSQPRMSRAIAVTGGVFGNFDSPAGSSSSGAVRRRPSDAEKDTPHATHSSVRWSPSN